MSSHILAGLKTKYGESPFQFSEAVRYAKKEVQRGETTVRNAISSGLRSQILFRVGKGTYSFRDRAETKYCPDSSSIIDVVAQDGQVLLDVFKTISMVSDGINLYFNAEGVKARFKSKDHAMMVEVEIAKEAFSIYHIKGPHILLGLYVTDLVNTKNTIGANTHHILVCNGKSISVQNNWALSRNIE